MSTKLNKYICCIMFMFGCLKVQAETVFIVHNTANLLSAFAIESKTGNLTPLNVNIPGVPAVPGDVPGDINTAFNKYLYIANWIEPTVSMFEILSNDKYTKVLTIPPGTVPTQIGAWSTAIEPTDNYAYTGDYQSNVVSQFRINQSNGSLTPLNPPYVKAGAGTAGIGFNPNDPTHAYVANMQQNEIWIYSINTATGQLTDTGRHVKTGSSPRGVWFDHSNHAYVMNFTDGTISMYQANLTDNGNLIPLTPASVRTGISPIALTMDNSHKYLYIASNAENVLYMYHIESSGVLTPLKPSTIGTGHGPRSMVVDSYNHLILNNMQDYKLFVYQIDPETGLLKLLYSNIDAGQSSYVMALVK